MQATIEMVDLGDAVIETKQQAPFGAWFDSMGAWSWN
jgi:hypothetical protein